LCSSSFPQINLCLKLTVQCTGIVCSFLIRAIVFLVFSIVVCLRICFMLYQVVFFSSFFFDSPWIIGLFWEINRTNTKFIKKLVTQSLSTCVNLFLDSTSISIYWLLRTKLLWHLQIDDFIPFGSKPRTGIASVNVHLTW
jgi:hypothetical protein